MFKNDIEVISLLIINFIIGVLFGIIYRNDSYNFIKDFLYFSKPIMLIIIGYFIAKKTNNWKFIFKLIILYGFLFAIYHIAKFLWLFKFTNFSISSIRAQNGLDNPIEIITIILILISYKYPFLNIIKNNFSKKIIIGILAFSFILYFSRTMVVGFFLVLLASLGFTKLNKKGIKYLIIFFLSLSGLYIYLNTSNINRSSKGFGNFLYKIKIAPEEIFVPKFDLKNHANLWDHWRAYEAYCALEDLNKDKKDYMFGKGFGALVDLNFNAPLNEEGMRYIPVLHNGYIYLLFKTGIIGLMLYLLFLMYLYLQSYFVIKNKFQMVFSNILSGISLYFLFTSLIITGLYNTKDVIALILGMFLYLTNKNIYKTA